MIAGDHYHACPLCYEYVLCGDDCQTEPDLGMRKGLPFGSHQECNACVAAADDAPETVDVAGLSREQIAGVVSLVESLRQNKDYAAVVLALHDRMRDEGHG